MAIKHGAAALGLVSAMPSGPGVISEVQIAEIAGTVPPPIATFLLTSSQDAESIIAQQRRCRTGTIQIVDRLLRGNYEDLRRALPGVSIVQVVHVNGPESIGEAVAVAEHVDAVLLDSGNPTSATKELGGTGRKHDWALSREIREQIDIPVFLAGGLNSENVRRAIRESARSHSTFALAFAAKASLTKINCAHFCKSKFCLIESKKNHRIVCPGFTMAHALAVRGRDTLHNAQEKVAF